MISQCLHRVAACAFFFATTLAQAALAAETKVNLLDKLEPAENAAAGEWSLSGGELKVAAVDGARIALLWTPTVEYDFEVEFTRSSGADSIALVFVAGGKQATFDIDGWRQHLAGIQNVGGQTMRENQTRVRNIALENGRRYTAAVRVRRDRVEGLLDGKVITTYRGTGSDLSLVDLWAMPQTMTLGLGAWNSATTFHKVAVTPVEGSPAMAAAGNVAAPSRTKSATKNQPSRSKSAKSAKGAKTDDNAAPSPQNEISSLSDEFDDPASISNWLQIFETEQTRANQLQSLDIGRTEHGWMTLIPHASSWYQDYRGVLVYKNVEGDFVITVKAHTTNRAGNGAPRSDYSLAGIMVRTPRDITPRTWRPGGENYIFLSHGSARSPGRFEFEVKTTIDSRSNLEVSPASGPDVMIQVVRVGSDFALLRKDGERAWEVHRRYRRPDMPAELQVGLTVYTDFSTISRLQPLEQNTTVVRRGNSDLRASFDFVRFRRPKLPADLAGRSIADPAQVSDMQLLQLFGEAAAEPFAASE